MIIYLDESKKIDKWKKWQFIFWWLITTYKSSTIDKLFKEFISLNKIKLTWWEIKSTDRRYKDKIDSFYTFLVDKWYINNIEFCWIYINEYRENWKNYIEMLSILVEFIINNNKFKNKWFSKVQIISDMLKLDIKENTIRNELNINLDEIKNINNIKKVWLEFYNSKSFWWLMFSDFVVWILRKKYINWLNSMPYDFIEYFVNKEVKIVKILNK